MWNLKEMIMKNILTRIYTRLGSIFLVCFFPFIVQAQNYDKLWKEVEALQQKDLPKSVIKKVNVIYEKARAEKNAPQLMKAYLMRASEQVKLTPDSAEVEIERMKKWAENETEPVTAAVLYHILGNLSVQHGQPDWNGAMEAYRRSLKEKDLLLKTNAEAYAPMTVTASFSERFFRNNLYDLLVRQTIGGLMSDWHWRKNVEVQHRIIDLYDSLIDSYGADGLNIPTAAMLSHEAKVLFLSEEGVASQFRLSKEQTEKALRDLLRLYEQKETVNSKGNNRSATADAFVDVYLKLSEVLCNQQKLVEAMQVLHTAQQKYPKSTMENDLRAKMNWIQQPSLVMSVPLAYPGYNGQLVVNYKNVTEVKVETYQLCLTPASPELNGNLSDEVLCRAYGKKVATRNYRLPVTADYQARIEKLAYQLPESGIYVMKVSPVDRKGKPDYSVMYVSPYQMLAVPLLDGRTEIVVADRISGNPVPYAEVVQYQLGDGRSLVPSKVWKTDKKGSIILKNPQRGSLFVNARTSENDFMKVQSIYPGRNYKNAQKGEKRQLTTLFTDRALYRPGQVIHVSGIQYEQLGDSLHTLEGKTMKVELLDANGKKVSATSATSDTFGVFAVDFTIPQHVLPGYFTIRTEQKVLGVRVENYKRPTFEVTFSPEEKAYTFGDALKVKGMVQGFTGAPVRLAKGTYRVVRSEAWLWGRGGSESQIASGTFTTDNEGKFVIDFSLLPPPSVQHNLIPYYNYKLTAAVTDGAGETQEGALILPVGKQSMGLQIQGLKSKMAREKREKIQFLAMNLHKQLVKTEVSYQVFALHEVKDPVLQKDSQPSAGKLVLEGKMMSQQSFVPTGLYALPAGKYQMKVSARDDQGRQVDASQDFVLFSLADNCPPIETVQWFYQDGENWENGKTVSLYVGSSKKKVYVLMDVFTAEKRIRSERIYLSNAVKKFDFNYDESYGDGIVISFAFLREGKVYTKQVRLERPKPQKQLTLKWESFRDQLTPGQDEVWRMKITDRSGNLMNANLLAALYDASLDKLQMHDWSFQPYWSRRIPYVSVSSLSTMSRNMFYIDFPSLLNGNGYNLLTPNLYSKLVSFSLWSRMNYYPTIRAYATPMFAMKSTGIMNHEAVADGDFEVNKEETAANIVELQEEAAAQPQSPQSLLRTNFAETAFYYPMLRTDVNGEVSISFTLPDALTEWKFIGFAHTQGMDFGKLTAKVRTSKPFMVQPNLPRFVRVGDKSSLAVSLVNLSMETVEGKIRMELVDPMTDKLVFTEQQHFNVAEGETGVAHFSYQMTDDYEVLVCRVIAEAGEFSDGEQHYLPVLTDKEWVTETVPFQLNGGEEVDLSLADLFNKQSESATGKRLTVELVANPQWYVIQALPVVGNPTTDNAISWATAYYANALAVQMVKNNPLIQKVFDLWMKEGATKETLWSKLEQNSELKNLLLEETPWLAEAQTETEQKRRVALLFEMNGMEQRLQHAARKLKELQTAEGGWTWYKGMAVNRYTTTQVVELIARLKWMGVMVDPAVYEIYRKGLNYLKKETAVEYKRIQEADGKLLPSEQTVHYLYICAVDEQAQRMADKKVNAFLIDRLLNDKGKALFHKSFSIYQKALMAIVMQANGKTEVAASLLSSIKEYLVSTPEMGAYFDTYKAVYSWNSYRIPTQVAAMEAIQRISPDIQLLNAMKQWLLKQKQVQVWNTPLATVDAIYAFLFTCQSDGNVDDEDVLQLSGRMKARIGSKDMETPNDALGYTRLTVTGSELPDRDGKHSLHVEKQGKGIGWGAVYAQYFERMARLNKSKNRGISIDREYWLGDQLVTAKTVLHTGDQLTVRLLVKVDRDMDFVAIKDSRSACMEPADQLSGYAWMNGVSAYRVTKDASTEYFIDRLPKGKHVFVYKVYLNRTGTYQSGSATLQSVYSPEFTSHTGGVDLVVE